MKTYKKYHITKAGQFLYFQVCCSIFLLTALLSFIIKPDFVFAENVFRIYPYVQNPAPDAMTILWFTEQNNSGSVSYHAENEPEKTISSTPERVESLAYPVWENTTFFSGNAPAAPVRHKIRLTGLIPNTVYTYIVRQNNVEFNSAFKTAPSDNTPIRFIVYSDSETEPESTGKFADWSDPAAPDSDRNYLLDQTQGYANNLEVIRSRRPDFVFVSGDLVESGGEQRDWDEFWLHNTNANAELSLASSVPLLSAPGNHEYYEGPSMGQYNQPGSENAINRFLTYFEFPANNASVKEHEGRYFSLEYGPIAVISLDVSNGSPSNSENDTNFYLLGENEPGGGHSPAFNVNTEQYNWLEKKLQFAQTKSKFTFVFFHHVPYSVGPHGWPAGIGDGFDNQSGVPVRSLTPLFMQYGVDAVFAGHDEILERSEVHGTEIISGGTESQHTIQFFDVGIGGDGLRGPQEGLENPYQKFLAHNNAAEQWENGKLVDGGKHYGHFEVDILQNSKGIWNAIIKPVYVFPLIDNEGMYKGYERRIYDDIIILSSDMTNAVNSENSGVPSAFGIEVPFPNPFNSTVLIRYALTGEEQVKITVYNNSGQIIRRLIDRTQQAGYHTMEWDGFNDAGSSVASGIYLIKVTADSNTDSVKVTFLK
ncbi:MAG: metallophosphoesterase [Candidatus Latescibacteria bacterium]|nr:metallophosphoesterase [Candidatus Latescibacterota bacterium]